MTSKILIGEMQGANLELAKNMVLKSLNVDIYDDTLITKDETDTNFMLDQSSLQKKVV